MANFENQSQSENFQEEAPLRVLVLTAMYPTESNPSKGTFVKEQVDSLLAEGIDVSVMQFNGDRSLWSYLQAGLNLRRKLSKDSFDIVHAHYGLTGLPALMQKNCPVIITFHGSDLLGEVNSAGEYTLVGRLKVYLGKFCGYWAKHKIVVAPILKDLTWGAPPSVIPMGVDLDRFRPMDQNVCREQLGLPTDKKLLLFLANPANSVKRFDLAKAATELAKDSVQDLELLPVFGIDHSRIPLYLNACDGLILTSNHEASPCVIKESLACNLPIVTVDVGDVAERIQGVEGCFLCNQNIDALAEGIVALFSFNRRTDGRKNVEAISLKKTAERTIKIYLSALK
jgi:teichuronic acid biosynthesis glycosyltransferase TuaC